MDVDSVDPRIEYECFSDPSPSEAWGRFLGHEWWLYARWDQWDFTMVLDPSIELFSLDLRGRKPEDIPAGVFFREAKYGDGSAYAAGYMTDEEKRQVVRRCIAEFEGRA